MAKSLSTKIILAVLTIFILAASVGIYALSEEEIYDCAKYCGDKYFPDNEAFFACMDGCIFIKEQ